ncbi:Hint domain-containing protein [Thioclava pacifica]|uniref:Hedgehog/Intein (Hint) domain-containing protein n=1 Tax=Thioclava pacifica DSM 10166 TaxID=1353537 RepID=A0A074K0S5_9RHOB|nr:Hint domain-containing protein [Thioclava pacifica]KEO55167.1 hypothetical protein TP2_16445 [Thioclava pacifica DSM 10166]
MDVWGTREESWTGDAVCIPPQARVASDRPDPAAMVGSGGIACGTRVATKAGPCAVEDLQPGMRLLTADHGYRELIRATPVPQADGTAIHVAAGALGNECALTLSARQRLVVQADRGARLGREIRIAVGDLLDRPGVTRADRTPQIWWQLHFKRTEIIFAEGLRIESLRAGEIGQTGLAGAASPPSPRDDNTGMQAAESGTDPRANFGQTTPPDRFLPRPTPQRPGGMARFLAS